MLERLQLVAASGQVPPDSWMASALDLLQPQLASLGGAEVVGLMVALSTIGCLPHEGWCAAAMERLGSQLAGFGGAELAAALWAVAELGSEPSQPWLQQAYDAISSNLQVSYPAPFIGWRTFCLITNSVVLLSSKRSYIPCITLATQVAQ